MKTLLVASVLLLLPIVFAGDFHAMWADIEQEWKEKMMHKIAEDDAKEPQPWEGKKDHKGWGEHRARGWGDSDRKRGTDDKEGSSEDEEEGWGRKEHRGWGEHRSKGWGDKKSEDDAEKTKGSTEGSDEQSKGWEQKVHKGWGNYRSRGWGDDRQAADDDKDTKDVKETDTKEQQVDDSSEEKDTDAKSLGDKEHRGRDRRRSGDHRRRRWEEDEEEDYVKEDVRGKYSEFKDYLKRKALKENEEQEAKAEIYRQMERVQMKKFLTEKLEQVMDEFEDQRMKFVFQATGHFLGLCQNVSNSRAVLERLDNGHFAEPEQILRWSNDSDLAMDIEDQMDDVFGPMINSTFPQMLIDPVARQSRMDLLVSMHPVERVKLVLHGYVKVMCTAAHHLTGFVEMVESHIVACKQGLISCDPFPQ